MSFVCFFLGFLLLLCTLLFLLIVCFFRRVSHNSDLFLFFGHGMWFWGSGRIHPETMEILITAVSSAARSSEELDKSRSADVAVELVGVSSAVPGCRSVFGLSDTTEDQKLCIRKDIFNLWRNPHGPNSKIDVAPVDDRHIEKILYT